MYESENSPLRNSLIWIGLVLLALVWFGTLNYRHLIPSDEGRYAEIAREMLVSGDWLTPRYNDYKYFEKPPLQMWATALAFKLFGLGEWQARLWSGLTSFLTILFTGLTAGALFGKRAGWLSAVILAASPIWILSGHFNSLDMGIAATMSFALFSMLVAQNAPHHSISEAFWMCLCWVFMGLAVLSKGLIGLVLPGLVLIVYSFTAWDWKIWTRLHLVKGIVCFLAVTAPWFILVSLKNPEFPHFFFIHEHFERFTTDEHRRTAPWHFFFPLLIVGFLPWLFQLPKSFVNALQDRNQTQINFKPQWLCLVWAIVIFAFFSFSKSKLPGYLVPIFPALAILAGISLNQSLFKDTQNSGFFVKASSNNLGWQIQLIFLFVLFCCGFLAISKVASTGEVYEAELYLAYSEWVRAALCIVTSGTLLAWLVRKHKHLSVSLFAFSFIGMTLVAGIGHDVVGRLLSGVDLANKARPLVQADTNFYSVKILEHTIPFYLQKPAVMVEFMDELQFGIEQEPDKWIPSVDQFIERWNSDSEKHPLAVMSHTTFAELKARDLPMEVVAEDPLRIIIKKPDISSIETSK